MLPHIIFPLISRQRQLFVQHLWRKSVFMYFYWSQYNVFIFLNELFEITLSLLLFHYFTQLTMHVTFLKAGEHKK